MPTSSKIDVKPLWSKALLLLDRRFLFRMVYSLPMCLIRLDMCSKSVPANKVQTNITSIDWNVCENVPNRWGYLLLNRWILLFFVIIKWKFFVGIIHCPLNKMIGQIKSAIIVCTIFKIDDNQIWFAVIRWCMRLSAQHWISRIIQIVTMLIVIAQ